MMVPKDNGYWFYLTLRSGILIIGITNCLPSYLTSHSFGIPSSESLTNLDIPIFVIFLVQLVVNLFFIVGKVKRLPSLIFPWIFANAVFSGLCLVRLARIYHHIILPKFLLVVFFLHFFQMTLFWGTTMLGLSLLGLMTVSLIWKVA